MEDKVFWFENGESTNDGGALFSSPVINGLDYYTNFIKIDSAGSYQWVSENKQNTRVKLFSIHESQWGDYYASGYEV